MMLFLGVILFLPIQAVAMTCPPYMYLDTDDPGRSIHIQWIGGAGTVHYGIGNYNQTATGTDHVHLTGLQANAKYQWYLTVGAETSDLGSFQLDPGPGRAFKIGLIQDTHACFRMDKVFQYFDSVKPELFAVLGDWTNDAETNPFYEIIKIYPKLFANSILVPVKGNHDINNDFAPKDGVFPDPLGKWDDGWAHIPQSPYSDVSFEKQVGRNYFMNYGNVTFCVFNGGPDEGSDPRYNWSSAEVNAWWNSKLDAAITTGSLRPFNVALSHYDPEQNGQAAVFQAPHQTLAYFNGHWHYTAPWSVGWIRNVNGTINYSGTQQAGYMYWAYPGITLSSGVTNVPLFEVGADGMAYYKIYQAINSSGNVNAANSVLVGSYPVDGRSMVSTYLNGTKTPKITSALPTTVWIGESLLHTVKAGGTPSITLGVTGLPPGLTWDGVNRIRGTPTTAGTYTVTLTASNAYGTDTKTVVLNVRLNQLPSLNDDLAAVQVGNLVSINVLANDTDLDGQTLAVSSIPTAPAHGMVTNKGTHLLYHATDLAWTGQDTFTYQAWDSRLGGYATATVRVNVSSRSTNNVITLKKANGGGITFADTQDTYLDSYYSPYANFGGVNEVELWRDYKRLLIRFDLSAVAGQQVSSAVLRVYRSAGIGASTTRSVSQLTQAWTAGTATNTHWTTPFDGANWYSRHAGTRITKSELAAYVHNGVTIYRKTGVANLALHPTDNTRRFICADWGQTFSAYSFSAATSLTDLTGKSSSYWYYYDAGATTLYVRGNSEDIRWFSTSDMWSTPGGGALTANSTTVVDTSTYPAWEEIPVTNIVRNWVEGGQANNGFLLTTQGIDYVYDYLVTSDSSIAARRPELVISVNGMTNQAPVIISAPWANPNPVTLPSATTVNVVASDPDGPSPLTYSWSKVSGPGTVAFSPNGTTSSNSSSASFSAAGTYVLRVSVSDGQASVASDVTVIANASSVAPTISTHPASQTVTAGQTATFSVVASGTGTLTYQWQKYGANISGATSSSYTTPAATTADSGSTFRVIVSNAAGSATSNSATLTVNSGGTYTLTATPSTVAPGGTVTVAWTAPAGHSDRDWVSLYRVGDPNTAYGPWYYTGTANSGTMTFTAPTTAGSYEFRTLLNNGYAVAVTSNTVTVGTTTVPPTITTHPANQTVNAGQTATYSVVASGTATLTYQWQKNGANIAGATSSSYTTPATTAADSGSTYRVIVTNSAGSATSNSATLTVNGGTSYTLTASPTTVSPGGTINVSWTAPAGQDFSYDWIGLFSVGSTSYVTWGYTTGAASGTVTFSAPSTAGTYEFRYYKNNGYYSVATSNTVTVSGGATYTLTATPDNVAPSGTVSVSWTAPAGQDFTYDWIGIFPVGGSSYVYWSYTTGTTSGTLTFTAPYTPGAYEFRYLKNNGYNSVATSNLVTVGTLAAAPAAISVASDADDCIDLGTVALNAKVRLKLPLPAELQAATRVAAKASSLPSGLRFSRGTLTGKTSAPGMFTFSVTYKAKTPGGTTSVEQCYRITVAP